MLKHMMSKLRGRLAAVQRPNKRRYIPGTLGLSAVSEAILEDYGAILPRRERKRMAREQGKAFQAYRSYYGEGVRR